MNKSRELKTSLLLLETDKPILEDSNKLRGCIANKFPEYPLFHNHIGSKYSYTYSRIQYKVIDNKAYVLGIEEGSKLIKMIDVKELPLGNNIYHVKQKIFHDKEEKIMAMREVIQYKFITPWLALNQKNFAIFMELTDPKEKKIMLNKILVSNIISMSKGLSYDIISDIYAQTKIKQITANFKGNKFLGFIGDFRTNFKIPDYFGLGKGESIGFGVIKNIESLLE